MIYDSNFLLNVSGFVLLQMWRNEIFPVMSHLKYTFPYIKCTVVKFVPSIVPNMPNVQEWDFFLLRYPSHFPTVPNLKKVWLITNVQERDISLVPLSPPLHLALHEWAIYSNIPQKLGIFALLEIRGRTLEIYLAWSLKRSSPWEWES